MMNEMTPTMEKITGERPSILVVEDDPDIAEMLHDHLEHTLSAELQTAGSAQEALDLDAEKSAEVVIVDYMLPDMDGLDLIPAMMARRQRPIILITGHPTLGRAIEAMRLGATDMFVKPFDLEKMTSKIAEAIEQHRQNQIRMKRLLRIRNLERKVIRERRSLRRKLDVMCRDVVSSYRDLAEKVNRLETKNSQ